MQQSVSVACLCLSEFSAALKLPALRADGSAVSALSVLAAVTRERALRALNELPPFSPILNKLLASLAKEDVSFAQVAEIIEKDTVLAGNVLRVVNSALYACRGTVNSVTHAIVIMGLVKLRNTALGFSVSRMWMNVRTPRGWSNARFNLHSVATAVLADQIAQRLPVSYPEGAFAAGLFHDLGKLLLAVGLPEDYEEVRRLLKFGDQSLLSCEREALGVTHAELSALALEKWNLPKPIQLAAGFHHDPSAVPKTEYQDYPFTLAHVIHAADATVNQLGISCDLPPAQPPDTTRFPALEALGLQDRIPKVMSEFQAEFEILKSMY